MLGRPTPGSEELEDAFPYTETHDQVAAIDEVKADMDRAGPIDRAISGHVGCGKTEIAVRAGVQGRVGRQAGPKQGAYPSASSCSPGVMPSPGSGR